jgi:4-amino-4-deoxy-L-arabinose transferase-like glycosyltransferase
LFSPTRFAIVLLIALGVVYFYGLTRTGALGPDEPRYAAIGREMARSGDWVTPRLWGKPWFEKPPLVYWMTALATKAGLGPEAAPRLPLAFLSYGFVLFFYFFTRREFGPAEALYATAVLGTSAGWIAYSYVAVTDVPMSVFTCAALLLCFDWIRGAGGSLARAAAVGALLGAGVLAKGLVPLVLFVPVLWPMRRRFAHLLVIGAACLIVAGPWYALCTARNGWPFLEEFFVRHHFERMTSDSLQHVRPFWFYLPVLLGAVFPWTPLYALLGRGLFRDPRLRATGLWLVFAFLFFSAAENKLPGYMVPLVPGLSLVLGLGLGWARKTRIPLFLSGLLLAATPAAASILPQALQVGLSRAPLGMVNLWWTGAFVLAAAVPLWLEFRGRRTDALFSVAAAACLAFLYIKVMALPATDRVRPFYAEQRDWLDGACLQDVGRDERYILQYYAHREFPTCKENRSGSKIMEVGSRLILLN